MAESLATRYRPKSFDDVTEQSSVKQILLQQLHTGEIKHAYLFTGGAGTGKTTCARIFANEINKGQGNPVEIDAASNNSVDDVRLIIQQSKVLSLDSEYRIWILDECHMLSNSAWNALLKVLEEPPAKAIFIMCTTDPQKIPKTILSRVQRFDFQRISQQGIMNRLADIIVSEKVPHADNEAVDYIAKIADGGMRDAITMLDKCLAYSTELTIENVVAALGTVEYDVFFSITDALVSSDSSSLIQTIEEIHASGKDLKQFIKDYMGFLLDVNKYDILHSFDFLQMPGTYDKVLQARSPDFFSVCRELMDVVVQLNADIKWDTQPKTTIEATLLRCIWARYLK